jgi:hypothetical protein
VRTIIASRFDTAATRPSSSGRPCIKLDSENEPAALGVEEIRYLSNPSGTGCRETAVVELSETLPLEPTISTGVNRS